MGEYYTEIMGTNQANFLPTFNRKWVQELESHKVPYCNADQIKAGNRLRPIILAWGYYINSSSINHEYIVDFAICIELIHKASILLDDLIDNDNARHGKNTFHIEYSKAEAILYAIFLINRSVSIMYEKDCTKNSLHTLVLLKAIDSMSKGGIEEVSSNGFFTIQNAVEIINLEATALIENSFFLGYQLSNKSSSQIPQEIINIGHLCGYCFQVLNDLEPFLAPEINKKYKGGTNNDFEKKRKNIVISYLYGACSKNERNKLLNKSNFDYVYQLIYKYKIIDLILEDVKCKRISIKDSLSFFKEQHPKYYIDFAQFLDNMFSICFQKCNLILENNFFSNG